MRENELRFSKKSSFIFFVNLRGFQIAMNQIVRMEEKVNALQQLINPLLNVLKSKLFAHGSFIFDRVFQSSILIGEFKEKI